MTTLLKSAAERAALVRALAVHSQSNALGRAPAPPRVATCATGLVSFGRRMSTSWGMVWPGTSPFGGRTRTTGERPLPAPSAHRFISTCAWPAQLSACSSPPRRRCRWRSRAATPPPPSSSSPAASTAASSPTSAPRPPRIPSSATRPCPCSAAQRRAAAAATPPLSPHGPASRNRTRRTAGGRGARASGSTERGGCRERARWHACAPAVRTPARAAAVRALRRDQSRQP